MESLKFFSGLENEYISKMTTNSTEKMSIPIDGVDLSNLLLWKYLGLYRSKAAAADKSEVPSQL